MSEKEKTTEPPIALPQRVSHLERLVENLERNQIAIVKSQQIKRTKEKGQK